jgi:nicotinamide phosphoribosyltransferase
MSKIQQSSVVDGYKLGHIDQYIKGTGKVYANMTPRSDKLARCLRQYFDGRMVFFGAQKAVKELKSLWDETFFSKPKEQVIKQYTRRIKTYLGSDYGDNQIEALAKLHDLGYLPLEIKTLPEGSLVDMGVATITISNTHPDFYWLTNYCETYLSCSVWHMCNAASLSREYYKTSKRWSEITGADPFYAEIANHCFAARGHRGMQDAMDSGMAHLLFSVGTDTLWAIDGLEHYYNADCEKELIGCSVSAFEHATATQRIAYYRQELGYNNYPLQAETESLRDIVTNLYPRGIVSYVADSEDYYGVLSEVLPRIKDEILARKPDSNGLVKFVVRPDSSPKTPLEVIVGDDDAPKGSPENLGTLQLLWNTFGGTINEKGFKVLNPKVGMIYGEAIDIELHDKIHSEMVKRGWCVSNCLYGVGSWGFLDRSSRDSFSQALKGTHSVVNDKDVSMQKNPKTAVGSKKSACGLLRIEKENGKFVQYDKQTVEQEQQGLLETVFLDGKLVKETSLSEIRNLIRSQV